MIKPLLQDLYVKHVKYRKRTTPIETYVAAMISFVDAAVKKQFHR